MSDSERKGQKRCTSHPDGRLSTDSTSLPAFVHDLSPTALWYACAVKNPKQRFMVLAVGTNRVARRTTPPVRDSDSIEAWRGLILPSTTLSSSLISGWWWPRGRNVRFVCVSQRWKGWCPVNRNWLWPFIKSSTREEIVGMAVAAFSMMVVVAAQLTHGARPEGNHNVLG